MREVNRALEIEPRSPLADTLKGQFLFHARQYEGAAEQLRTTLERYPTFWIALLQLGTVYQRGGRYEEALAAFTKAGESGDSWTPVARIGHALAVFGQREAALRTLDELHAAGERTYVPPYHLALVYHGLRDPASTLRWLERAYEERDVRLVFLGVDPAWDSLREHPGFIALLQRMNLTSEAEPGLRP
jgi:tetratricopeptide (TPR) repeat protein